jgi:hypothetical protein
LVSEGKGRLFRRNDGKFLLYLPKDMCEDSAFPWKLSEANHDVYLKVTFTLKPEKTIIAKESRE